MHEKQMKKRATTVAFLAFALSAVAAVRTLPTPPESTKPDTESSTCQLCGDWPEKTWLFARSKCTWRGGVSCHLHRERSEGHRLAGRSCHPRSRSQCCRSKGVKGQRDPEGDTKIHFAAY